MAPRTISSVLRRMNLLVSSIALLIACAFFAVFELAQFRRMTLQTLSSEAQIVGANSVSALTFGDAEAATSTLSALAATPDVLSAQIHTPAGERFAEFRRDTDRALPAVTPIPPEREEAWIVGPASVVFARRILFDGVPAGTVTIEADISVVYQPIARVLALAAIVLVASLGVTLLASRLAQRTVSQPIRDLATLTQRVSRENDYGIRADSVNDAYEIALLKDSFNTMLAGIEERDRSLHEAHDRLEARVHERTEELEASNKELESFSYSVSHDLRAPLRHIGGFANLLNQHAAAALDEKGRRYVTTILDSTARMGQLIDDLLAFSRMGRTAVTKRAVDLNTLVDEVRREVSMDAQGRTIAWQVQPLPVVEADPALLRAAVVNLLSNAVKYTSARETARIEVGTEPAEGEVVISVRDNGAGFDMAYAHKLFGVFQRLHAANEFAGTGIGLANVRRIIQRHGGRAWAVGEVGVGATFYFSLPQSAVASVPAGHHAVA